MNLPVASILVLFYTLVAWVCVWNIIVNRRADANEPALHTHLIGIILGAVAAFGTFLIGATTALPTKDDEVNMSMNLPPRPLHPAPLYLYSWQVSETGHQHGTEDIRALHAP